MKAADWTVENVCANLGFAPWCQYDGLIMQSHQDLASLMKRLWFRYVGFFKFSQLVVWSMWHNEIEFLISSEFLCAAPTSCAMWLGAVITASLYCGKFLFTFTFWSILSQSLHNFSFKSVSFGHDDWEKSADFSPAPRGHLFMFFWWCFNFCVFRTLIVLEGL